MGISRKITPQLRERAVEEYRQGVYPTRTARRYDIKLETLRIWVLAAGLEWVTPNIKNYPRADKRFPRFEQMHKAGKPPWEIRKELHLGERTYKAWAAYLGPVRTEWKPQHLTWAVWDEVKQRYQDGQTLAHINTQMGLHTGLSTIQHWLVKAGYPRSSKRNYEN